jgi:fatty aldehyde-generating acyl-ACP reductase
MNNFAFIIHPIDAKKDVARRFPLLGRYLSVKWIDFLSYYWPPAYLSHVTGVRSLTGAEIEGWLVACPLTPKRMLTLPVESVYKKIVDTGHLAERLGARLLGLGAYTSVVGDAGVTVAKRLDIPVTTGDSYTVAVAIEAAKTGALRMGIDLAHACVAVVGATGAIGRVCAECLLDEVGALSLIGRRPSALNELKRELSGLSATPITTSCRVEDAAQADVLITVSSAMEALIKPEHLKRGAVVCDVARPRDVAAQVARRRNDVLVIDGGIVQTPGPVRFGFDFGLPGRMAYACMAETMLLALEGRYEDYTLGRRISPEKVKETARLAQKHGFRLSALRSFDRSLSEQAIEAIRERAHAGGAG